MDPIIKKVSEAQAAAIDAVVRRLLSIYGYPNRIEYQIHPNMLTRFVVDNVTVGQVQLIPKGLSFKIVSKVI